MLVGEYMDGWALIENRLDMGLHVPLISEAGIIELGQTNCSEVLRVTSMGSA